MFARALAVVGLLATLNGCANFNQVTWDPNTWFNTKKQDDSTKYATPGFGKGPLTPPSPAPAIPVQAAAIDQPATPQTASVTLTTRDQALADAKVKIAILLPLTGSSAALGQSMLNAAQMAVFDVAPGNFELMPRDTAAKGGADAAAHDAVASGAQLIIGPLFATDVATVKTVAMPSHVPVIALSTDASVRDRDVYVAGFLPEAQVNRVVSYALHKGMRNFAALVPGTPYGTLVARAYENAVLHGGGTLVSLETYDPAAHDSASHVQALGMMKQQIQVLFIPEVDADLALISSQLAASGFAPDMTHFVGTGLWDEAGIGKTNPLLLGSWYAAPDQATRRTFSQNYRASYGQDPVRLASLAYDATALTAALAKHGVRHFDEAALTNPNGFAGLDGIFRLNRDGLVERGLAVNEVTATGAVVADPAPNTFAQ